MTSPAVSIVCCVRDGAAHLPGLRRRLEAVAGVDHEVVLLDNGSSDGSAEELDRWADELPRTTVLHDSTASGAAAAQAAALLAAGGEYVWLIDCDDRFVAEAPAALLAAAREHGADVVVARGESVDTAGRRMHLLDAHAAPGVLDRNSALQQVLSGDIEGYTWTKLFRRSIFDEECWRDGFAPPLLPTQGDLCRVATAVARSARVVLIADVVYSYVRHGDSVMDRREPPLANLARARDHVVRIARALLPDTADRRRRIGHFTAWFLATSAIQIPFYVRAGRRSRRAGRRLAHRAARSVRPWDVLRRDRVLGAEALLLRLSPRAYELAFRLTHRPSVARSTG